MLRCTPIDTIIFGCCLVVGCLGFGGAPHDKREEYRYAVDGNTYISLVNPVAPQIHLMQPSGRIVVMDEELKVPMQNRLPEMHRVPECIAHDDHDNSIRLKHSSSPTSFLQCVDKENALVMECAPGTVFDPETMDCSSFGDLSGFGRRHTPAYSNQYHHAQLDALVRQNPFISADYGQMQPQKQQMQFAQAVKLIKYEEPL